MTSAKHLTEYRAARRNNCRAAAKANHRKFRDEWKLAPRAFTVVSHAPVQPRGRVYRDKGRQEAARRLARISA